MKATILPTKTALAMAAALALAPCAQAAMRLSPRDLGQVLLFPYYTVQQSQSTLVSVVNTTGQAKALRVDFREARNGNLAFAFTLLLGPHDTWTGSVFDLAASGPANLVTSDRSCTLPSLVDAPAPQLPDGRPYHAFENTAATTPDGGPATPARTREGYLQVVELGTIASASPLHALLTSPLGPPSTADCNDVQLAITDVAAPTGGLYGTFAIVHAASGTLMGGAATAIEDFSNQRLGVPVDGIDNVWLAAGSHVTRVVGGDMVVRAAQAEVPVGGSTVELEYLPYGIGRVDAVSALLMADSLYGAFIQEPAAGASTAWVISAPTKHVYVDPVSLAAPPAQSSARAPYREKFSETVAGQSCMPYRVEAFDREQRPLDAGATPRQLCHSVDVLSFGAGAALGSDVSQSLPGFTPAATSGAVRLVPGETASGASSVLPAGFAGPALRGLPVIGFEAVRYTTGAVPGTIVNYTYAVPLRASTSCADAAGLAIACP